VRIIISHVSRGQTFVVEMYLQTGRGDMDEAGKAPTNLRSSSCDWYGLIQRHGWKEMAAQPTTTHYRDKSLIKWLRPMRVG
jgi:hypothetical protein